MIQLNKYYLDDHAPVIPDGKTVVPTDDIQTWIKCAGRNDLYTTLADVLADSECLSALMADDNAVDYLVRSTTWTTMCANVNAMTQIGANNYCANTLLDDATWVVAICSSTYVLQVLNAKVPSNVAYADVITYSNDGQGWYGNDRAFNGSSDPPYTASAAGKNGNWVAFGYRFSVPVKVVYFRFTNDSATGTYPATMVAKNGVVQGSNDGSNWTDIYSFTNPSNARGYTFMCYFTNPNSYKYYREKITEKYNISLNGTKAGIYMQFYGRVDV